MLQVLQTEENNKYPNFWKLLKYIDKSILGHFSYYCNSILVRINKFQIQPIISSDFAKVLCGDSNTQSYSYD